MARGPEYRLAEFVAACLAGKGVTVLAMAERDASRDFGIETKAELLQFIGNNGLEKTRFVNCREWENSRVRGRLVDAYQFYSGETPGYISFAFCKAKSQWFIKSFHRENSPSEFRHLPFSKLERLLKPRKG
jgi:hypothetical protein